MEEFKGKLKRKFIGTAACMVVVLFVCLLVSMSLIKNIRIGNTDNQLRLELSSYAHLIQRNNYVACQYPYVVVGIDGLVWYENQEVYRIKGKKVNVEEILSVDASFQRTIGNYKKVIFTIKEDEIVEAFLVFLVPNDQEQNQYMRQTLVAVLPLALGSIICVIVLILQTRFINSKVLKPIGEISESADAIINGNYDKEVLRVYDTMVRANEIGEVTYSFELMRDELKKKQKKEEELKKAQQELISCISHDLKTPISTIKAYSEGLRDGIARTQQQQKEYIQIIIDKTNLLNVMISELLEYSNMQLQQMEIIRKEVYLIEYLNPLMKELEGFVVHNGVAFACKMLKENPIVTIDQKRITEVFYNLIENSLKYRAESNAKIRIEMERIDQRVHIRIQDNGKGINANDIPYVFDKFYRAEKSRSLNIPGSGLGLSICKYIIEQHGGEIYCKSLSQGCEFGFWIQ